MFDMKKIGKKISVLRKEANMTQMELADRMGISFQAVPNRPTISISTAPYMACKISAPKIGSMK